MPTLTELPANVRILDYDSVVAAADLAAIIYDDYDDMAANIVSRGDGTVYSTRAEGFAYVEDSGSAFAVNGVGLMVQPLFGKVRLSMLGTPTQAKAEYLVANFQNVVFDTNVTLTSELDIPDGSRLVVENGVTVTNVTSDFFNPLGSIDILNHGTFAGTSTVAVIMARVAQTGAINYDGTGNCVECKLLGGDQNGETYASIDTATDLIGPITINNPRGVCTTGDSDGPLVRLFYCSSALVTGGYGEGYRHGIAAWGGDSNFGVDGANFNQERKCKDVKVVGFVGKDFDSTLGSSGGGVWGSMVDGFLVDGCTLSGGADVGIDFEGCFDGRARNNKVRDFGNANYSTFFGSRDCSYIGNHSVQRHGRAHFRSWNSSANPDNQRNISWIGNTCRGYDAGDSPTRLATVDCTSGPIENWVEADNTYINTVSVRDLDGTAGSGGTTTISGNTYRLDEAIPVSVSPAPSFIDVRKIRNRFLEISRNTLHVDGITIAAGSYFVNVKYTETNRGLPVRICNNSEGFAPSGTKTSGIYVTNTSTPTPPKAFIFDNTVWGDVTLQHTGATAITQVKVADNFRPDGNAMSTVVVP